jgi:hypothetical protein
MVCDCKTGVLISSDGNTARSESGSAVIFAQRLLARIHSILIDAFPAGNEMDGPQDIASRNRFDAEMVILSQPAIFRVRAQELIHHRKVFNDHLCVYVDRTDNERLGVDSMFTPSRDHRRYKKSYIQHAESDVLLNLCLFDSEAPLPSNCMGRSISKGIIDANRLLQETFGGDRDTVTTGFDPDLLLQSMGMVMRIASPVFTTEIHECFDGGGGGGGGFHAKFGRPDSRSASMSMSRMIYTWVGKYDLATSIPFRSHSETVYRFTPGRTVVAWEAKRTRRRRELATAARSMAIREEVEAFVRVQREWYTYHYGRLQSVMEE